MKKFIFLLLCFTNLLTAQELVGVDLSSPKSTIYTHLYFLQPDSYNSTKAASVFNNLELQKAEELAIKLKKILDGKGLQVEIEKLPFHKNYKDSITFHLEHKFVLFPAELPEIYVEKIGNNWYFSSETAQKIPVLFKKIFPFHTDKLQELIPNFSKLTFLSLKVWQYLLILILIILSFLLFYILKRIVYFILKRVQFIVLKKEITFNQLALKKLTRPIVFLLLIIFLKFSIPIIQLPIKVSSTLFLGLKIMSTIFWIYVFLQLVRVGMNIYKDYAQKTSGKLDDQLIPILHNILSGLVVLLGILHLLTLFGVEPVTVLAGVSIGGLAVALAAQDTVKNLIGTIIIFIDKPFHIGDWIETGEVVGTIEAVGFRSTQIRAADTSIYQIPNSKLSEIVVKNKGLLTYRRYSTNLGIRYDTPIELIEGFVEGIRKILQKHPDTRDEAYNVEFIEFGDFSLKIYVNTYFNSTDWGKEQASKHNLHIKILKLAKELGVEFAFPTTTLAVEQFPEKQTVAMNYNTNQEHIDTHLKKLE